MSVKSITLCVSCGLPGSGKTTYWRKFYEVLDLETALLIIEYDKIIPQNWLLDQNMEFAENAEQSEEKKSWKSLRCQVLLVVQSLIQSLQISGKEGLKELSKPDNVRPDIWENILSCIHSLNSRWLDRQSQLAIIIDDNMYFRSMRYDYFKLARKYGTGFCQVYFNSSLSEVISRNMERGEEHRVPEVVIVKMSEKLEPPNSANHAWERLSIVVNMETRSDINHQSTIQLLKSSLSNPVQAQSYPDEEEVNKNRVQNSANLLHQGDLILRKCVAAWVSKNKKCGSARDTQAQAKDGLRAKDLILKRLREDPLSFGVCEEWPIDLSSSDPSSDFYRFISKAFLHEVCHPPT
ncbi:hypothetical protein EGW08_020094 [Elysia chlorotica]|uniref:L-seryl-tRNA(Sec) kinase n=1 Tax=Elysia chlorotica TaxID=188477 RepID=A0A433SSC5_ELYCH|nr:hypothetical protein EGW08_020094 [Elysia chlorotica]